MYIQNRRWRNNPVVLQTAGNVVVIAERACSVQPRRRNIVAHVRAADAEVQALTVREVFIKTYKEPIRGTCDGDRVQAIVAVAVRARSVIQIGRAGRTGTA